MMYRRFGYVQTRLVLQRQEELRVLEKKLERFDARMKAADNDSILRSGYNRLTDEDVKERNKIMDDLQAKYLDYGRAPHCSYRATR
jgi:predicted phage tail protein